MDEKRKRSFIAGLVAGLAAGVLAGLVFGSLPALLIGIAVGAAVTAILIARARGENPVEVAREAAQQAVRPDPGAQERPVHEQLCRLNQRIRLEGLSMTVVQACERLIDLLRDLVPRAQQESAGTETTFDLEQLAKSHLPKLMKEYLDLGGSDRTAREADLVQQLQALYEKVTRLKEHLDMGQLHEFEVEHGFLKAKF